MLVKMSLGLAGKKTLMSERLKKFKKKVYVEQAM